MPPALPQRFLLQPGNAATIEIGLPGGKFFLGEQVTGAYVGGA